MTVIDHARKYIAAIPGAVSGQQGHSQTFSVAVALVNGFELSESDAMMLLSEYNQTCSPPWSEKELEHKIREAITKPHDKPTGHLLKGAGSGYKAQTSQHTRQAPKASAKPVVAKYVMQKEVALPKPIEDSTRLFLREVFRAGEGVSICKAKWDDEFKKEVPDGSGIVLMQEDWLRRLDRTGGDPNGIFKSDDKTGIFIRVNPMKVGGAKDADVTAYRYALIEFDKCSISEQWSIYQQSNIPCAAIILSGGKSVHAWVKVDAKDAKEFAERVRILHEHFAEYGIDAANKNPSRFSRLPGCERFKNRQELIALNVGASSFLEWQTAICADDLGELFDIEKMESFDPENDPDCIIGDRWMCRGGSCLIVGPSGVGKSSMSLQFAILWRLGKAAFGMCPKLSLKSLFVQAENNFGDMSEMLQGVKKGMQLTEEEMAIVRKGIVIRKLSTAMGYPFIEKLTRMIELHKPDLVWIDPLLAYIGGEISKQEVCSQFLRNWLNPIGESSGVCFMIAHHTNKPIKDPKSKKGFTNSDLQYEGAGSAELVNWSRAVMVLQQQKDGNFILVLAKRGWRAGAQDFELNRTLRLKLAHSTKGICWEQLPEEKDEKESHPGAPKKEFNVAEFVRWMIGKGAIKKVKLSEMAHEFSKTQPTGEIGASTIRLNHWPEIESAFKFDTQTQRYSA